MIKGSKSMAIEERYIVLIMIRHPVLIGITWNTMMKKYEIQCESEIMTLSVILTAIAKMDTFAFYKWDRGQALLHQDSDAPRSLYAKAQVRGKPTWRLIALDKTGLNTFAPKNKDRRLNNLRNPIQIGD